MGKTDERYIILLRLKALLLKSSCHVDRQFNFYKMFTYKKILFELNKMAYKSEI